MWIVNFSRGNFSFGYLAVVTFLLVVVLAIKALFFKRHRNGKLPPGPFGIPIFGYYFFLRKDPVKKLRELAEKYGNVVGFYIGPKYVVVLNDWEAMTEAYSLPTTLHRPLGLFAAVPFNLGMLGVNGAEWHHTRRMTSKAMRDIGLNKSDWEELVYEEVLGLVHRIAEVGEKPIGVRKILSDSFVRNMLTMVSRQRLPEGHPSIKKILKGVDAIIDYIPTLGLVNCSPTLSKLLQLIGVEGENFLVENTTELANFISDTVDEQILNPSSDVENSFIGRFLDEIQRNNNKKDKNHYITVEALKGNIVALLTAGGETIRSTVIWTLIAMADNPEKQRKVHEELDSVIGRDGSIRYMDRARIPYTFAAFLESMRWRTVGPFPVYRMASEDITVQGYHIPKGTFITVNKWLIHNDSRYWEKPDEFIPERFLLEDGQKVNTAPDSFTPFSYGKRNCPGKHIAEMEGLLYFAVLMQKFKVVPKSGLKVKCDTFLGINYKDKNAELRFIPR